MDEMNSLERVMTAMKRGIPDRVPLYEAVIDEAVMEGIAPGMDYPDFVEWFGLDVVGLNRSSVGKDNVEFLDEERKIFKDYWGVTRKIGKENVPYPIDGPIKSREDLKNYTPPDPSNPKLLSNLPEIAKRFKGKKAIVFIGRDAYFNPSFLRGPEEFLMDYIRDPEFVHDLVDMCLDFDIELTRRAIRAGVDIVIIADDYAWNKGPVMSRRHFEEFILPGLKRVVDAVHEEGALCIKHTDGNIMPIIDLIVGTGIDALNPIEPKAGMDIAEVKKLYGDRVALVGNIDCGELLGRGTPDEVRKTVKETIAAAGPGGGFILASSNSIHSSVKPENYLAMRDACMEFGRYPLQA